MSALGHVWMAPWQELSDLLHIGQVRSCFRPVCAAGLAAGHNAMRGASQSLARTSKCDDPNGFSRSPDRPCPHYVIMSSPIP